MRRGNMLECVERVYQIESIVTKGELQPAGSNVMLQFRRGNCVHHYYAGIWNQNSGQRRKPGPKSRTVAAHVQNSVWGVARPKKLADLIQQDVSFIQIEGYFLQALSVVHACRRKN